MRILVTVLVLALMAVPAVASVDWQLYDFGTSVFDENNNFSPIDYGGRIGNLPSPGHYNPGGENYDLEGANIAITKDYVYISLTNSFGYREDDFRIGDLFIGVNDGWKYQYAVDLRNHGQNNGLFELGGNNDWNYIQNRDRSYYSNTAIRNAAGAHEINWRADRVGDATSVWSFYEDLETDYLLPGNGDTYVWEICIDRSLLGGDDLRSLSIHVNVGCGNDLMEKSYTVVPEPGTMLLFGLGLLGGGIARRYRRRK